ncbi:peptidase inhibitor I78 family protein [Pantoea alhagi]|uniref:Peptidase inhibitor I78 family protein n=1 Tax=Pantoea alhagi TaxID=1891675 RepID=A0A1W6B1G2_9GAMM|nr:I78 family peptidase inhibitor [Pantoea alhagi]ARJ40916.1 peptidase inhibitor I78 family protein [Pantoea alhagi]URQ62515.1 I78 family peptidase inhibitor [Pantoea alhagi]
MKFYGKLALITALVTLAACQHGQKNSDSAAVTDPDADRCGASAYQNYVGQPLSALSKLQFEHPVRAIPYNSAVTMDFNLNRLNFLGDKDNVITRVYCG